MFLFIIGLISIAAITLKHILSKLQQLKKHSTHIKQKYGQDCWAIVTGATDGIGKAYCQLLAEQQVNICMIIRNQEKGQHLIKELSIKSKSKFRLIITDFKQSDQPNFFEKIEDQLKDLDIGLLINNVGISYPEKEFIKFDDQDLRDLIVVNCYPVLFLTKKLIPLLLKRKKSGIINVSSFSACMVVPYMSLYAATKAFVDFFSKALNQEYDNIDILSHQPLLVSTPMTNYSKEYGAISPYQCALGGLQRLGIDDGTPGYWKHRLQAYFILCMPDDIRNMLVKWELRKKL